MKVPALFRNAKHLCREQRGVVLIEMVIVLPVFLLLTFGVISFGYVFVVYEDEAIVVSTAGSAIQNNPGNPAATQAFADAAGQPFITFTGVNTICAKSYAAGAAIPNPYCVGNNWVTGPPAGVAAGTAYVVAVEAQVTPNLVLPAAYNWLIGQNFIQKTTVTVAGATSYPTCAAGQLLTSSNGTSLTCVAPTYPTCAAGQVLTYTAGALSCIIPTPPSGSFCGNAVVDACAGSGATNASAVVLKNCTVGGVAFNPSVSCPAGYTSHLFADSIIKSPGKNNCFYTCVVN